MTRKTIGTVLLTLLVLGALGAIGFGLYQTGLQQGLVENGADVVTHGARDGFRAGRWGPGWGWGFGFFGIILRILFFVLLIGLVSRLFWGPRRWGPGPHWAGDWDDDRRQAMESRFNRWHDQAHGDGTPSDEGKDST